MTSRWRPLVSTLAITSSLLVCGLAEPGRAEQSSGFEGFLYYIANPSISSSSDTAGGIAVEKLERFPNCEPWQLTVGIACHVETSTFVNSGFPDVWEVNGPSDLETIADGMRALVSFDPHSGRVRLEASTPQAAQGEFRTASARLLFDYNFTVSTKNRFVRFRDYAAETIRQIPTSAASVHIFITRRPSVGEPVWEVLENLTLTETKTRPDHTIDLFDFMIDGDQARLTVEVELRALSTTNQIGTTDPSLGALPASSAVSFRLNLPKQ